MINGARCLLWTGHVTGSSYGYVRFGGRRWRVHVLVYFMVTGHMPLGRPRELVLHRCEVNHCGEIRHLYLGTGQNNVDDRDNHYYKTR